MSEMSLLLGAGFSVNQGYPTASELNKRLEELNHEDFYVHTSGVVVMKEREFPDPCFYSDHAIGKFFLIELIEYYTKENSFNYEEFYDFYNAFYRKKTKDEAFDQFCNGFRGRIRTDLDNQNLLSRTNSIFNQLIIKFLKDREGNTFYKPVRQCKPILPGYDGFLYCLEGWGKDGSTHIHTLNHDIFFETFKDTDWLDGNLTDGFDELGSPFFGRRENGDNVRLAYFSDRFKGPFRLYKLHGSIDQVPFHIQEKGIDTYIKTKQGISKTNLYKEVQGEDGNLTYINDWINYHADFLSGTTSKILRYREPFYYGKMFEHFETNLSNSSSLVVIGYGCRDIEINNIIETKFDFKNKPCFIVEPYPSESTISFIEKYGAQLISRHPGNMSLEDFNG